MVIECTSETIYEVTFCDAQKELPVRNALVIRYK